MSFNRKKTQQKIFFENTALININLIQITSVNEKPRREIAAKSFW